MCQITSNPYGDPAAISLGVGDFQSGGLLVASFARPGKLFTVNQGLMVRSVGVLNSTAHQKTIDAVIAILK